MTKQGINTRLWQKLVESIHGSIFVDTPENTGGALVSISIALGEDEKIGAAYLNDEDAKELLARIRPFLEASAEDEQHAKAAGAAPLVMRAKRLTLDEKRDLGLAVWDLYRHLSDG